MDELTTMMQELAEAPGVSGSEQAVRAIMQRYLEPYGEIVRDNLGGIGCRKVGVEDGPRILLAAHMDEIGFLVTRVTDDGFVKFQTLGGWPDHVLLAQRVEIWTRFGPILGLIGAKPIHLMSPEERKKLVDQKDMFIDIGAASKEEAIEWGVRPGDMIVPVSPFQVMKNNDMLLCKAWDNRYGCALVIETLRRLQNHPHPNIVYGVGNVQEELGLRGARTMTHVVNPDVALVFDVGIAGDTPGVKVDEASCKVGHGPVIVTYDRSMVPHRALRELVLEVAEKEQIEVQHDRVLGGTDGGVIHLHGAGVPTLVIGAATRYIHSHNAIIHRQDVISAARLVVAVIQRLDTEQVQMLKTA